MLSLDVGLHHYVFNWKIIILISGKKTKLVDSPKFSKLHVVINEKNGIGGCIFVILYWE